MRMYISMCMYISILIVYMIIYFVCIYIYMYTFLCVYVYLRAKPFCLTSTKNPPSNSQKGLTD